MDVTETIEQTRQAVRAGRQGGAAIGLVPTMGALHAGHYSLIDAARQDCGLVVVSIFVNPIQFAPHEDLASYPRTPREDLAGCEAHGAGVVFMPTPEVMYGSGPCRTQVAVPALSGTLCGASRPTHFAGVCTVVAKLFNIVLPDRAYFGAKDYQQVTILRRMVADLNFPLEVVTCPTVREADGLAMSSRNAYLTPQQRKQAPALYAALNMAAGLIRSNPPPAAEVDTAIRDFLARNAPEGIVDYVHIVDPRELSDVVTTDCNVVVALAVKFGRARLIDNMLVV
jgi:pantoate--beta-alanine ligase